MKRELKLPFLKLKKEVRKMKGFLCPEEKEFVEKIISKGFEVEDLETRGLEIIVYFVRTKSLSKQADRVEYIEAHFELTKEEILTNYVQYVKELHTDDGRVKILEEKDFRSFKELLEELEREEMPIPA